MTRQREPDPTNRFETWADGVTPSGHRPPTGRSDGATAPGPPTWAPASGGTADSASTSEQSPWHPDDPRPQPLSSSGLRQFPTYPYAASSAPFQDPRQDEAYAAFPGYQARAHDPHQAMRTHQGYRRRACPSGAPHQSQAPHAVPSFMLGIISVFSGGVTGPIGLGFGISALRQIEAAPGALRGRGLAIAGIATSAFGTLMLLLVILGILAG